MKTTARPQTIIQSAILSAVLVTLSAGISPAGSATWNSDAANHNWTDANNWTPPTVPNGPTDTATFGFSNQTNVVLPDSNSVELNQIVFDAAASPFTIAIKRFADLTMSGTGMVNNSGINQIFLNLVTEGQLG